MGDGVFKKRRTCDKPHYPYELPKGWCWTTLGDIAESNIGLTYKPSDICLDGIPVYRSNNIKNGHIDLSDVVRVNTKILEKQFLNEGDLLICARNGSRRLVGKNAIISQLDEPAAFGAFMAVCRSTYNPWICLVLNTTYFDRYLDDSNSATINQVTQSMLLAFPVPFPPKNEQDRIINEVAQLESVVANINDNIDCLNTVIKQTKSKILNLAIHGKLVPQAPTDEPAYELLKRINPKAEITCDNPQYGNLPKGWCICRLKDMAKVITGSTPSKSNKEYYGGNFPFYKPVDLDLGRHVNKASEYLTQAGKNVSRLVPPGTTAVCCIGSIGKVGFLEYEGTTNQQINCAIPSECLDNVYLYYSCSSQWFYSSLIAESSAVTISIVNKSKMENVVMPLPPLQEQHRIVAKIEELFTQLDKIEASL